MTTHGDNTDSIRKITLTAAAAALIGSLLAVTVGDAGQVTASLETLAGLAKDAPALPMRGDWPW